MRKMFPGHFRPKPEEFDQLLQECIFAFDTNVLLNVYRYTPETQEKLFAILEKLVSANKRWDKLKTERLSILFSAYCCPFAV
jgi:hypothetical protein